MKEKNNSNENILYKLLKALKLEFTTSFGRTNLAAVIILVFFCLLYTANDTLGYLISSISDVVKTIALHKEVYHPYESPSLLKILVPIFILIVPCLYLVYIHDNKKRGSDKKEPRH